MDDSNGVRHIESLIEDIEEAFAGCRIPLSIHAQRDKLRSLGLQIVALSENKYKAPEVALHEFVGLGLEFKAVIDDG